MQQIKLLEAIMSTRRRITTNNSYITARVGVVRCGGLLRLLTCGYIIIYRPVAIVMNPLGSDPY